MAVLTSCSKILATHDLGDPKPVLSISPHKGNINASVWNHNNQVIATCGSDGKIILNHSQKGTNLLVLEDENNKTVPINSISFTSNSQHLASGGNDGILKIWDLKKRALGSTFRCHFSSINSVHWNLDDSLVASCSMIGDIVLHNLQSGNQVANFSQKGSQGIKMIKFSQFQKNVLASAGMDGSVCIWDINARQTQAVFNNSHSSRVNAITFSTFNPILLCSVGLDQKVIFYDIRDKKIVKSLQTEAPLTALSFYNDGHTIVVGSLYGGINVYDLKAGSNVKMQLKGHESCINFLDFIRLTDDMKKNQSGIEEEKDLKPTISANQFVATPGPGQVSGALGGLSMQANPLQTNDDGYTKRMQIETSTSSKNLRVNAPSFEEVPQKVLDNTKGSDVSPVTPTSIPETSTSAKKSSVLDPYDELKNKYNNIEEIRKNALEKIENKKIERGNSLSDKQQPQTQASQQQPIGKPPSIQWSSSKENIIQSAEMPKKTGLLLQDTPTVSTTQKRDNNSSGEVMSVAKTVLDKFDQKSDMYTKSLQGSRDFSEGQKEYLKECFSDMKNFVNDTIQSLHVEMIRQFQIQQNEFNSALEKNLMQFSQLYTKLEEVKQENERLKKTSF